MTTSLFVKYILKLRPPDVSKKVIVGIQTIAYVFKKCAVALLPAVLQKSAFENFEWSIQGILKGEYHCTIDLLFDWFGLVCFANKNKNCQLSYS